MKKILSVLLVAVLCFGIFSIAATAENEGIVVSAKGGTVQQGNIIVVPVTLDVNKGFQTLGLEVSYDAEVLEIDCPDHVEGENCAPSIVKYNLSTGNSGVNSQYHTANPYRIQWAYAVVNGSITQNVTKTGDLALISFKVKNNAEIGNTKVTINVDQASKYDTDAKGTVPCTVKGGVADIKVVCGTHQYKNNCKVCDICGEKRDAKHTHDNACDTDCNVCGIKRTVEPHTRKIFIVPATASKDGYAEKRCTICGQVSSKRDIKKINSFALTTSTYLYNGKARTPGAVIMDSAGNRLDPKFYTITYSSGRVNVGEYNVTVKLKGDYSGSESLKFTIVPPKTTISSVASGTKSFRAKVSKKSTQVTGYQIQYATKSDFSDASRKTVSNYTSVLHTFKNLKAKTTYYVRVRTFKTINGKHYYSPYSAYKTVKTN